MHLFYDITYFVFSNVQMSKPQTCRCQSHIAPASQRRSLSLCKCIKSHHWFWLPASYASSPSLLQMFTGPMPQLHFQSGAFSSSSSSSSLPGSMQEHMRCTSQPATAMPQSHLCAIIVIGSGYQPAMRAAFSCCRCHGTLWAIIGSGCQPALRAAFSCSRCSRDPCHRYIFKAAPSPPPPPHPHYRGQCRSI